MKPYLIISALTLLIILVIGGGYILMKFNKIDMSTINNGKIRFEYDGKNILTDLSKEDLNTIKEIFDGKKLYKDNLSCGFNEKIALVLNDSSQTFSLARDACPIIYVQNEGLYFKISDEENAVLRDLLKKYGFECPCL